MPIGGLSTFAFRGLSSVPPGTEWVFGSSNNHSARITVPQCNYAWWWAYLPTSGHLTIHNGWTWVQDTISWQWFNLYFPHMPCYGASPQGGESSQHDHGGQWTIMGAPGHLWSSIGVFHPQKTHIPSLRSTHPLMLECSIKPVGTSSQVSPQASIPDDAELDDLTLREISLPFKNLGLGTGILSRDVIQLQEEVGKALGCLSAARSSLNACHRKQVLDFEMALHQNKSETTKAVKEAKTLCTCTTREAEAHWVMLINEAEAQYTTCIKEAEANCLHHSRGREPLLYGNQEGRVLWCQSGPLHSTVTCQGHAVLLRWRP